MANEFRAPKFSGSLLKLDAGPQCVRCGGMLRPDGSPRVHFANVGDARPCAGSWPPKPQRPQ